MTFPAPPAIFIRECMEELGLTADDIVAKGVPETWLRGILSQTEAFPDRVTPPARTLAHALRIEPRTLLDIATTWADHCRAHSHAGIPTE